MTPVERVAEAVDSVTEQHGLSRGEALWVFTAMLQTTLAGASPDVRDALRAAVVESLNRNSLRPLVVVGAVRPEQVISGHKTQ
jgi:hypothetical protein